MTTPAPADVAPATSRAERRERAARLAQSGRLAESLPLWREELCWGEDGRNWVRAAAVEAMAWRDLTVAGALAELYAAARWGSRWWPEPATHPVPPLPVPELPPRAQLSIAKLEHDIDQFRYLRARDLLDAAFDPVIDAYLELAQRLRPAGPEARPTLTGDDLQRIGETYNRIVHVHPTARAERTLSPAWSAADVEDNYLSRPPGLVVIDDFLTAPALDQVRRYCLESTVWSGTRYAEGRLGAFFLDGFASPLLLQIAEDLRAALPRVIGDHHPLRQMWGFKYAPVSGRYSSTHADFAAVNVNFWITDTDANLDQDTGGLVVYDLAAPLSWDFKTYNERPDLIDSYLRAQGARRVYIPYRANRAILFNSDLFHATAPIRFRPDYEHRRINITFLYGDRADDRQEHAGQQRIEATNQPLWRSRALGRSSR